jgi:sugar phosphate isomerase/epimerase
MVIRSITRRSAFLLAAARLAHGSSGSGISRARLSVLTDECAKTHEGAIEFAHQYGLKWVELRSVPGERTSYFQLPEDRLKGMARSIKDAGLRVSFLNTGMLKFHLPDKAPSDRAARAQAAFDGRLETLRAAIRAAQAFEVDKIRVFAFLRTENPESVFPRLAEILGDMARTAEREGVKLLLENEPATNGGSTEEVVGLCAMVGAANFGINWDPFNDIAMKRTPFPDSYRLIPKEKLWNVQAKAKGLVVGPDLLDWNAILSALAKDGYKGQVGLETHIFDGTLLEKAHQSVKKLLELTS